MKTEKPSFSGIKNLLSRDELKKIVGGTASMTYVSGCKCIGCKGSWVYTTPVTVWAGTNDVHTYCSCGAGSCTYAYGSGV